MIRLSRKNKAVPSNSEKQQAIILPLHSANRSLDFLVDLIGTIRPENAKDLAQATVRFKALLYQMSQDRSSLFSLRKALLTQFLKANIVNALTESGILSSRGFVQELRGKVLHKLLPELQTPDNFLYVIIEYSIKKGIIFGLKELTMIYGYSFLKYWVFKSI
jgi:site-specific recombinase